MALKIAVLTLLSYLIDVEGHGYLTFPVSRRLDQRRSSYTADTAFGAGQTITNCGKAGLSTPDPAHDVVSSLQRGTIMKFDMNVDAHHAGHIEMNLCPFVVNGDSADLSACISLKRATAAEAGVTDCQTSDDRDICAAIDPNNPSWWYLAPKGSQGQEHSMWFHIPSDIDCPDDRCSVQFTWKTANSCNPHPQAYCNYYHNVPGPQNTWCNNYYCGSFCSHAGNAADNCEATAGNRLCCSEVFAACAEVTLTGESLSPSTPLPGTSSPTHSPSTPLATPSPTVAGTSGPEPEPEPEPTTGGGGTCVRNTDCVSNAWCNDVTYDAWCADNAAACPSPHCIMSSSAPTDEPEPEPEPEATTSSTTGEPGVGAGTACVAGSNDQGVTDESCEKCTDGYAFWPCNVNGLCICSASTASVAPAPSPATVGSHNACDDGSATACKTQCTQACGGAVGTNQCWGAPRYVECKCSDGSIFEFGGCACESDQCGKPAALVEQAYNTHRKKIRKHKFMAGDHMMIQAAMGKRGLTKRNQNGGFDRTGTEL